MLLKELISKTTVGSVIISTLTWDYFLSARANGVSLISLMTCNGTMLAPGVYTAEERSEAGSHRIYTGGAVWVVDVSLTLPMTAGAWMEIENYRVISQKVVTLVPNYPAIFIEVCAS